MKYSVLLIMLMATLISGTVMATNGHQMIGVGAIQKMMGGAVTANPEDATTAISNPAGMANVGDRTDFHFEAFMPKRQLSFANGGSCQGGSEMYLVPALGWTAPINDSGSIYFGGGMYGVSGMGVDFDSVNAGPMYGMGMDMAPKANIYSNYQFWKMAPTLAFKVNEALSLGVSLNLDYQALAFEQVFTGADLSPTLSGMFQNYNIQHFGFDLSEGQGALGFGLTLGGLYKVSDMFTLGLTYTSEQMFQDFEYRLKEGDVLTMDAMGNMLYNLDGTYKMEMNFPQQLAFGIAVNLHEKLTVTADIKWINFESVFDEIDLRGSFVGANSQTFEPAAANKVVLPFGWEDTIVYAMGIKFAPKENLTIRAGFNHSNSPIDEKDVANNLSFPAMVENHITFGGTYTFENGWEGSIFFMKAFENELTGKGDLMGMDSGTTISLEETSLGGTISYHF